MIVTALAMSYPGLLVVRDLTKSWDAELVEKLENVPGFRPACEELMRTPSLHDAYLRQRPRSDGSLIARVGLDELPVAVRDIQPDYVVVESNGVLLGWDGEIVTSFWLLVLPVDQQPSASSHENLMGGLPWKRQGPGLWTHVD